MGSSGRFALQSSALKVLMPSIVACLALLMPRNAASEDALIDTLPGIAQPWKQSELSLPISGIVSKVFVRDLETVSRQTPLLSLDQRMSDASLKIRRADAQRTAPLKQARIETEFAQKYLHRIEEAHRTNAASALELDEAQGRLEQAKARQLAAQEDIQQAQAVLELEVEKSAAHQLQAPFDGVVSEITVAEGAMVSQQTVVMRLSNLSRLRVMMHLPVRYQNELKLGRTYRFKSDLPDTNPVPAKLLSIGRLIDAATKTIPCLFEIDNENLELSAGFEVHMYDFL